MKPQEVSTKQISSQLDLTKFSNLLAAGLFLSWRGSRVQWDPILPAGTCCSWHRMGQSRASEVRTMGWHRTLGLLQGQKKKEKLRYLKKKKVTILLLFSLPFAFSQLQSRLSQNPSSILGKKCVHSTVGEATAGHSWCSPLSPYGLRLAVFQTSIPLVGSWVKLGREPTESQFLPASRHQSLQTRHLYFLSLFTKVLCGAKQRLRSDWQRVVCPWVHQDGGDCHQSHCCCLSLCK